MSSPPNLFDHPGAVLGMKILVAGLVTLGAAALAVLILKFLCFVFEYIWIARQLRLEGNGQPLQTISVEPPTSLTSPENGPGASTRALYPPGGSLRRYNDRIYALCPTGKSNSSSRPYDLPPSYEEALQQARLIDAQPAVQA